MRGASTTIALPRGLEATFAKPQTLLLLAVLGGSLVLGLTVRVWELGSTNLWADEILTEYRAEAPLLESLDNIIHTIDQTPFYFLMLRVFPVNNELLLRLPSALLGVAGILAVIIVVNQLWRDRYLALWAGVWLALNPYHIWLSRTARAYALIFLLSLLMSFYFLMLCRDPSRKRWLGFTIISMVAYVTHYSLLAIPFTQLLFLVLHWRKDLIQRWSLAQVVAVLPMFLWGVLVLLNLSPREPQWGAPPALDDLGLTFWNLTAGYDGGLYWYTLPGLTVAIVGVFLALYHQPNGLSLGYWGLLFFVPVILVFGMSIAFVDVYVDRYFMALLPGLVIMIAAGWSQASRSAQNLAMCGVVLTGAVTFVNTLEHNTNQREDWESATRFVEQHYAAQDFLVVDRKVTHTAFERYFDSADSLAVWQLSETEAPAPECEGTCRYWVIYRHPYEDIHRLGAMPEFDPLEANPVSVTAIWLQERRPYVEEYRVFAGLAVVLVTIPPIV
ncbi:MAG: hypothetical protein GYB66_12545 [Chloroflexi bacterium]|nr:hypothetical protein [Chloroflexota bacterium]